MNTMKILFLIAIAGHLLCGYGEEEKKARKNNLAYVTKTYPQAVQREFKGLAHVELVLMFPERFFQEVTRFQKEG